MPTNKNTLLRYKVLDRCFSNFHRKYEIEDLLEKVNDTLYDLYGTEVSLRQIRDDIKYMRDSATYNAPIKAYPYDGKKCYYRYENPNYSIFNNELSEEEISSLRSTIDMLGRFRDGVKNAWLEEVISNLEYRFGVKTNNEKIVSFEQNEQLQGLEFLSELIDAAVNHSPLRLLYRTYSGKENMYTIHPYHIKQYNNRWFLFGLEVNKYGNRIANRPLDRIVSFSRATDVEFAPNKTIEFDTYFKDIVGVTIPDETVKIEKVILKFEAERFPYIKTKPIHHSQEVLSETDNTLQLQIRPNRELEAILLSFGSDIEILSPQWLRDRFSKIIAENFKKYLSVQNSRTDGSELCVVNRNTGDNMDVKF